MQLVFYHRKHSLGYIKVWRYIIIYFGWLFPKSTIRITLYLLRNQVLNVADLSAIKHLNEIKFKQIDYNLLDNICRKYSIHKFRYKHKCLINAINTEGELINNADVDLWIEELGYEYSESEAIRKQNMEETKKKYEQEMLKQENIFLKENYDLIPEFSLSLKHISYTLSFIISLVALIRYVIPYLYNIL